MEIRLFINKSVHENAAYYYEEAKKLRKKAEGLEKAIEETKKELDKIQKKKKETPQIRTKREQKWYEKFHWFYTSGNKLVFGGKDAQQNDLVVSRHMEDNDLFFHADIQGASAIILKDGKTASEQELLETAQFAASFSSAWKNGNSAVDVYAVGKGQLSKAAPGGFIPTGAFAIDGKRIWFKSTPIKLLLLKEEDTAIILPAIASQKPGIILLPSKSGKEKGAIAKQLAKQLSVHPDIFLQILPSGKTKIQK